MTGKLKTPLLVFGILAVIIVASAPAFTPPVVQPVGCPWCEDEEDFYLKLPYPAAKFLSLGQYGLAGAMNYFQAIYYYGKGTADENGYLPFFFDRITDHDPHFYDGYYIGALLLGNDRQKYFESLELLQKAEQNLPDEWMFSFLRGYYLWTVMGELDMAAEAFRQAAAKPRAPQYLLPVSHTLTDEDASPEKRIRVLQRVLTSVQDPQNREKIFQMIQALEQEIATRS
ncbi:MAG: hypothetical protein ACLFNV_13375 [Desulfovibrionales bacterium]